MPQINEYFDGQVKSISLENPEGSFTVGVMDPGHYTFTTAQDEEMTVLTGILLVQLPGDPGQRTFNKGQSFNISASSTYDVKVEEPTAYLCRYIG